MEGSFRMNFEFTENGLREKIRRALIETDKKEKRGKEYANLNVFLAIIREVEYEYIYAMDKLTTHNWLWRLLRFFKLLPDRTIKDFLYTNGEYLNTREKIRYRVIKDKFEKRPTDVGLNNNNNEVFNIEEDSMEEKDRTEEMAGSDGQDNREPPAPEEPAHEVTQSPPETVEEVSAEPEPEVTGPGTGVAPPPNAAPEEAKPE